MRQYSFARKMLQIAMSSLVIEDEQKSVIGRLYLPPESLFAYSKCLLR